MTSCVLAWWAFLCVVSVFNVGVWLRLGRSLRRLGPSMSPDSYVVRQWQLVLSGAYVVGCAFRSFLPRADVQRICLVDSWWSSVMVGRSVATVAELCFAIQWALLLHEFARSAGSNYALRVSQLLVPLIVFAETNSWFAVLTTNFLGNAIEQSTWAVCGVLLGSALWTLRPNQPQARRFRAIALWVTGAFLVFMCGVDIPMYASRWLSEQALGRHYLAWRDGWHDAAARWIVTFAFEPWRKEMPWMALYFSVGVWMSLALTHAPRFLRTCHPLAANAGHASASTGPQR